MRTFAAAHRRTTTRRLPVVLAAVLSLSVVTAVMPVPAAVAAGGVPAITKVSPAVSRTAGGTTVTLTGTDLSSVTRVMFGARAGTKLAAVSDTEVRVVAPSGSGTVDVRATSPAGTSPTSEDAKFRLV